MQRLKKAIKRMAAIGAGVAMLGATMGGAVAQNLADYPQPFVDSTGVFNEATTIVVGAKAAASDTLGAVNIATRLQFDAKVPVSSGSGTLQVSGGVTEDIPLGEPIANTTAVGFDVSLEDTDIESFQDTQISFQGKDYNVHDELLFGVNSPSVETSLTSKDDDYEDNVFLEAISKSIRYYYAFDDKINVSKATSSNPLEVKFLGRTLKITDVGSATKFTAYVGGEYFMDVGDVVTVDGKKITLENVGEGGAILVDVDGTRETISASSTKTINGIEVSNDETFYTNEISERSASLIIGKDAQSTYEDGDAFVGEDENDPDWEWEISNLREDLSTTINTTLVQTIAQHSGPIIGIRNAFTKDDDTDDPPGIGECLELPNEYVSLCLDSLTTPSDDYLEVTIKFATSVDTAKSGVAGSSTSAPVISITAPGNERFVIKTDGWMHVNASNNPTDAKTSSIYLQADGSNEANPWLVFYRDPNTNPSMVYAGNVTIGNATAFGTNTIAQVKFGDTKTSNVLLQFFNQTGVERPQFVVNITGDSSTELFDGEDVIVLNWTTASGSVSALGSTANTEQADEVVYLRTDQGIDIGTKDEDHRTRYGIIIKDPKSNGASDQVVLLIPSDMVQGNVVVKGPTTRVSGGAVSYIPADISINTRLDTEIAGSEANFDLILVGGPCANSAVSGAGVMTCEQARQALSPGEALIKMASNGENVALLVAGYEATETRMAAKVLQNYEDYSGQLKGSEVKVTGTLSQPSVTAMTA